MMPIYHGIDGLMPLSKVALTLAALSITVWFGVNLVKRLFWIVRRRKQAKGLRNK